MFAIGLLAVASAIYASLRMFSGFSFYDDEGSLVLMSRWLIEGHRVYRDFQSIYGPFFYIYRWIAHTLAGSVTHTAGRMIGIVPWVLTSLLAFSYTLRLTRSRLAALTAWVLCLRALSFIAAEPGHPQEICILLLLGLVFATARHRGWKQFAISGAILAALTLTKVNLGIYAGAAVALATLSVTGSARIRNLLWPLAVICAIAPVVLTQPLLGLAWVRALCALTTASILMVIAVLMSRQPERTVNARQWGGLIGGFATVLAAVIGWTVVQGGSLNSMWQSTLIANLSGAHTWTVPFTLGIPGFASVVLSMMCLVLWLRGKFRAVHWVKLAVGGVLVCLLLANGYDACFAIGMPFAWLLMIPRYGQGAPGYPRVLLASLIVLHGMTVYPVAASQLRFTMVLLGIAATLCLYDALWILARGKAIPGKLAEALPVAAYFAALASAGYSFLSLSPLGFPGTTGIRVDQDDRANYAWVIRNVQSSCDSFVSFPAMHSFYLWTGKIPPIYPDVDGWQAYLSRQRQSIEMRILDTPRACVLYVDKLVPFWLPMRDRERLTLLGFIQSNFVEADSRNGLRLLVRKP